MSEVTAELDEGQRQMMLLALAELALSRPGWNWTLGNLAEKLYGRDMFEEFKVTSKPFITETRPEAIERMRSATPIRVNAQLKEFTGRQISYEQVVALSDVNPTLMPTVTYCRGIADAQGILNTGATVQVRPGMLFDVCHTGSA